MRYRILLLSLAMLAACGDDPGGPESRGPRPADISEMRVVKISGDQAAQVPPPEVAGLTIRAVVGQDGWTSEPLVARVRIVQPRVNGAAEADSLFVPPGTLVHWRLEAGCGELFASTTATDDSAYTYNRWAPGTKAGTCTVQAGRLVNGNIVIDTTWTMQVLPGPSVALVADQESISMQLGDTVALSWHYTDAYGNRTGPCPHPVSMRSYNESVVQTIAYGDPRIVAVGRGAATVHIQAPYGPGACVVEGRHYANVRVSVY